MSSAFAKSMTVSCILGVAIALSSAIVFPGTRKIAPLFIPGTAIPMLIGAVLMEIFLKEERTKKDLEKKLLVRRLERCLNSKEASK